MGSKRRLTQKELMESLTRKNPDLADKIQEKAFKRTEFRPWNLMNFPEIDLDSKTPEQEVVISSAGHSPAISDPVIQDTFIAEKVTSIVPSAVQQTNKVTTLVSSDEKVEILQPPVQKIIPEVTVPSKIESFQSLLPKLIPYLESPQIIWVASAGEKTLAVLNYLYSVSKQNNFMKNILFTSSGLSREIGVDSNTIRSAIRRLLSEGIIIAGPSKQGRSGYFSISFSEPIIKALKS